ncbi:MAG TPA: lipase family protein [Verrucomicrobiae bacterium]|nr:lipase family protein [Verrucomicrobiae bacterium]
MKPFLSAGGLACSIYLAFAGLAHAQSVPVAKATFSGLGVLLNWTSTNAGSAYSVQFQDTLADGIWRRPESPVPFPVLSNSWSDFSITNQSRFYRVVSVPVAQRGRILSVSLSNTLSTATLAFLFNAAGVSITPQYSVRLYKLDYETISPLGARTVASGALLLPENTGTLLPLLSYQHGTITQTNDAPSAMDLLGEVSVGVAFATSGYAAIVPDYLGLGDSPGFHPYHHARSEATACVDMLRAAKSFCDTNGFALTNQLFLCGYSQGGHATMALLREIEAYHSSEFTVTACAPMAGAYDLSGVTTSNFLSGVASPNPYYFLYLLAAYQDIYHLAPSLSNLLTSPYDTNLPALLAQNPTGAQLNAALPANPVAILKPEYLAQFRSNSRHPLRLALEENDLYRWRPKSPLRLYHCAADQDVIFANSQVALDSFHAAGASQVQLIDPLPTAGHSGCSQPSLLLAKAWFDLLR